MRLITLDILCCVADCCKGKNLGLKLRSELVKRIEQEFNQDLLDRSLEQADLEGLIYCAQELQLRVPEGRKYEEMSLEDKMVLFESLFEQHVEKGSLVCQECKSVYKIINGIPNMIEPIKEIDNQFIIMKFAGLVRRGFGQGQVFRSVKEMEQIRLDRIKFLEKNINKKRKDDILFMAESLIHFSIEELVLIRNRIDQENEGSLLGSPLNFDQNLERILREEKDENMRKSAEEFLSQVQDQLQPKSGQGQQVQEQKEELKAAPEKTKFDINVVSIDTAKKLNIIKEIKNMLNLSLKESKELVEKGNFQFKQGVDKVEAEQLKETLEKIGCKVELS